jgi:hypothetical protein
MLAGLLVVAASVVMVAAAAFCLIAGIMWLCCELSDLRRGQ